MTHDRSSKDGAVFSPVRDGLRGTIRVPGDKSISHRAVLLGAVNDGSVSVSGFLRSADTMATIQAVRALGVGVDEHADTLTVHGNGWPGLQEPDQVIDVGNSGTLMRLLPGLVASREMFCVLTGDASIRRRPMARVLEPLMAMGASVVGRASNTLPPVSIRGGSLRGMEHTLAVASAQVKSCILLASLRADGQTSITEPGISRDHTERMIRLGGGRIERDDRTDGTGTVHLWPVDVLRLSDVSIPGDFSSAAFFLVAALLVPGSKVRLEGVGLNPTRIGLLQVLKRMGAQVKTEDHTQDAGEPVGAITAEFSELSCTDVDPGEIPALIDELPLFLLAAARARGRSQVRGAKELRVKESDRLTAMARLLETLGRRVVEHEDGLQVTGDPTAWPGGAVETQHDHRLAMVGAVAGAASMEGVMVDDVECIAVSYPDFVEVLQSLAGDEYRQGQPVDAKEHAS